MSRKQRQREREQQRKDRKRPRGAADQGADNQQPDHSEEDEEALRLAAEIADRLGETEPVPRGQIERIVVNLGAEQAEDWLRQTLQIENQGGMMLSDGSRRKTPGGVYFKLVRDSIPKTDMLSIFFPDYEQTFPLDEQELTERLASSERWPRAEAGELKFSLVGRPAKIAPPDIPLDTPYVVFELAADPSDAPALVKGLPPVTEPTTFRVFVRTSQWPHVAATLSERADAKVSVRGYAAPHPRAPEKIAVYATDIRIFDQHNPPRASKTKPAAPQVFELGTVKWFSAEKGYGFVTGDQRGDVFMPQAALADGRTALAAGDRVYFGVREGRKGPEAADVHLGMPPAPPGPARPTLALQQPAIPARAHLRLAARPPEMAFLGRPGQPPSLIGFRAEAKPPKLAEGMPTPPSQTDVLVLIPLKLWKLVRDEVSVDAETPLLISGYCSTDRRTPGALLLRATHIDTAAQQQRRYEAERLVREARRAALESEIAGEEQAVVNDKEKMDDEKIEANGE